MNIKLIPVIEIFRSSDNIKSPEKGPYWLYPDEWERYSDQCLAEHGFSELTPYTKGCSFYEIAKINDAHLLLQIEYKTKNYSLDEIYPLDGGYILNVNGEDVLYPQCCGDLADIEGWIDLSNGNNHSFWQGHPCPAINITQDRIRFNLRSELPQGESFVPTPPKDEFEIDRLALKLAVNQVVKELHSFAEKLNYMNTNEQLGFENLSKLLIGDNF
ncbi:hypothetical protein O2K51_03075 [Apibacter raozihei]|uniref:hypothetical protein n=1 Tax=Apibacter raozihei TaxID=2500547 RepID=UPI000FE3FDB6|nr:hypothetical protein [Apibacter raozihei]